MLLFRFVMWLVIVLWVVSISIGVYICCCCSCVYILNLLILGSIIFSIIVL